MTDRAPHIFRSLERRAGKESFDDVVEAAVAAYGSLRAPSERQARELARLVAPLWSRVGAETRRTAAAVLSHAATVPREVTELLLASPVEIAAPFLVSSPALTESDVARLERSADERVARIARSRRERAGAAPEPAAPALGPRIDDAPSIAPDLADLAPEPAAPPVPGAADEAREALRRLALAGRRPAPAERPTFAALHDLALARDEDGFYAALGALFRLRPETLAQIRDEAGGERLAVALRATGAGAGDAMSVLMMLKPAIGLDVRAFDRLARTYRALGVEDCRRLLDASRAVHQPLTAPDTRAAESPRPEFGRRKERPAAKRDAG